MKHAKYDLENKISLITGAAGLLGKEHAYALLESGATVILTDIDQATLQNVAAKLEEVFDGSKIHSISMDVSDQDNVQKVHDKILEDIGKVDILVNNAAVDAKVNNKGIEIENSRLENFPVDEWEYQLKVGLTGAFYCSRTFGKTMAQHGYGVILNIASDLSVISPDQRLYKLDGLQEDLQPVKPVTYSVIKAGLLGLTRYLSTYWASNGVRANALSPGGVYVSQGDEFVSRLEDLIPMGRMAARDEYHGAIQFMCSEASAYLNGQNIIMDGGRSVL